VTPRKYIDLRKARVLISNDDGIDAPGLKTLEKAVRAIAKDVWVVAPETEQSAAAHAITLRRPLRIRKVSKQRFAVDGTPTDCVLLAINEIMSEHLPDIVLSGINRGGNLGDDVTYSGTIAAVIEGTILGVPGVAFSQHFEDGKPVPWATAEHWIPKVLKKLAGVSIPHNTLINVNFPDVAAKDVTGIHVTRQGARKLGDQIQHGSDPRAQSYYWIGQQWREEKFRKGTDLSTVYSGGISVTPLSIDLTDTRTMKTLQDVFK